MSFKDSNLKRALKNLYLPAREDIIVLEPHFGLGDNLVCLGLMRALSRRNPQIRYYYACLPRCYHSLAWMFQNLDNVFLFPIDGGREVRQFTCFLRARYAPIGIDGVDIKRFDESFYEQHKVPFEARWSDCDVPPGPKSDWLYEKLNPHHEPYILVCNDESGLVSYDLKIANLEGKKVITVAPETNNIFDWTKLVLMADEIHTIDTSFVHFVESLLHNRTRQPLFYHLARNSPTEFTRRLPWQVIRYRD
ncbi:hypothetical protein C2740_01550 [Polynucleobacter sp. MG-5-Ahmo-C2]|uniref:hypothetical protein n=1 Tax=Polynucleobacter sp. MG-5-Ahmo-C2 TaxID=2081051 RepID=UPI001BFE1388|nr:hypothetical protein [Polynucleobacter sp. MG-5-Ahmo-C2]QWD98800.1 hypothetical protein C2740_01550 [Polynucleobacter sp. MG-5-Ahmo-C2]